MFQGIYKGRRILITGHSGFQGTWLSLVLQKLGAKVCGASLRSAYSPSHFSLLDLEIRSEWLNLREAQELHSLCMEFQPEIVFHLASQSLAELAAREPGDTFSTNLMGTVNLLETLRVLPSVKAAVIVTGVKPRLRPNREGGGEVGGEWISSASMGCVELAFQGYLHTFFAPAEFGRSHHLLLGAARTGNVIGGGDWAPGRLVSELVRAAAMDGVYELRSPGAVRPWMHVLDAVSGYLELGRRLWQEERAASELWTFGPDPTERITVRRGTTLMQEIWPRIRLRENPTGEAADVVTLESAPTAEAFNWRCVWSGKSAFEHTGNWYKHYYEDREVISDTALTTYWQDAEATDVAWMK